MDDGGDTKLYADDVWFYVDENRAVATGNVVFRQGNNQISADRADFDTKTRLGTFYNASGFATAQPPRRAPAPGGVAPPPLIGQDTIVYFFGETVEKIGPRKYKITKGGFTTCVQPTPRWDLHADTIVLNLDHYTLLKQVVMNVKGVPLFYLPILYYPTKKEDRATGFLLPDLRDVDASRTVDAQRVLLGDQSQPGRDHPARLVLEGRSGRRHRVSV